MFFIETTTFQAVGDTELWCAGSPDNSWRFPLFVNWKVEERTGKKYAYISPALTPYANQSLLLTALLGSHSILQRPDRWMIPERMVELTLLKAPGITPEAYYIWPDEDHLPPIPVGLPMEVKKGSEAEMAKRDGFEDFLGHICAQYKIPPGVVRIVLKALASEAPKWMLRKKRVLDLGFVKLFSIPLRANWKEIVTFKTRDWGLLRTLTGKEDPETLAFEDINLPEILTSPHNVGMNRNGYLQYNIEAIPGDVFDKEARAVEHERAVCGQSNTVAHYENTIEKLYRPLVAALERYLRKTKAAFVRVSDRWTPGCLRFDRTVVPEWDGYALDDLPVHIIPTGSRFSVLGEARLLGTLCQPPAKMPKVPALLSTTQDVRQCEGAQPTGVPLLSTGQS